VCAAASGVAKTTIYRHWPDRAALILDAVHTHFEQVGSPDTGSLAGDLKAYTGMMRQRDLSGTVGDIMPCVIEAARYDVEMAQLIDRFGAEREAGLARILERARDRGELVTDLDMERLMGVLLGPIVFQKVVRRRPLTAEYVETCIDVALAGIAARGSGPGRDTGDATATAATPPGPVD
jgi:AcrR family transcriptional regulator